MARGFRMGPSTRLDGSGWRIAASAGAFEGAGRRARCRNDCPEMQARAIRNCVRTQQERGCGD